MPEKCQNFSVHTLRADPNPCLFVLLSSTLGYICYIYYIFVKHVNCPLPGMRETSWRSNDYELIQEVEIVGTGRVTSAKILNPLFDQREMSQHSKWLVGISREYTLAIACKCTESCTKLSQTSFWRLELTQARYFVLLFFHPLGCILCVGKQMWNTPGQRREKPLEDSDGHE